MPDPRETIRDEFDEQLAGLLTMLTNAISSTKKMRFDEPCPQCTCKHIRYHQVPDIKTQAAVADMLLNQGYGRPDVAEGKDEERITFIRLVNMEDHNEAA